MGITINTILLVCAVLCWGMDAFGRKPGFLSRVHLTPLGLFLVGLSVLIVQT